MPMQISISNAIKGQTSSGGGSSFLNQYSFEFDGATDYVQCGNPTSLQITGNLTISAWIKTTNTTNYGIIVGKDAVSPNPIANPIRSYMLNHGADGVARFVIWKSTITTIVESTTLVNDGNWHHVMGVNDGTDLKIYVDGVLENTNVGGGGTIDNGNTYFAIGRREANAPQNVGYFNGNIDEVAVWNSDQSANVSTIYNSGVPNDLSSLSPISWWRMGENATWTGREWNPIPDVQGNNDAISGTLPEAARTTDVPT